MKKYNIKFVPSMIMVMIIFKKCMCRETYLKEIP